MRWSEIDQQDCSIAQALSVVGDRWTMLVLREAFMRVRRFEDLKSRTGAPGPSSPSVSRRSSKTASSSAAGIQSGPTASSTASLRKGSTSIR